MNTRASLRRRVRTRNEEEEKGANILNGFFVSKLLALLIVESKTEGIFLKSESAGKCPFSSALLVGSQSQEI
ncbi:hypothetical protein Csa_003307 [Cucumis sativus]|uniref:Uncharacterized protein n=1 Tax=Cucumis sativus TaxID=3659 RepID=A0A0A0KH52_CUCSA|nr:hypothetical protein Csa_003307 [Cucumis sativus]